MIRLNNGDATRIGRRRDTILQTELLPNGPAIPFRDADALPPWRTLEAFLHALLASDRAISFHPTIFLIYSTTSLWVSKRTWLDRNDVPEWWRADT